MDISNRITKTRKERGFTQQILADKANLSLSTIKRIENGKVTPRIHTLTILSEILDIDLIPNELANKKEENNLLVMLVSILLLFLPPLNILFLLKSHRKINSMVNRLLVFQTFSLIIFIVLLFVTLSVTYVITGHKIYGQLNTPLILYMSFVIFNIFAGLSIVKAEKH